MVKERKVDVNSSIHSLWNQGLTTLHIAYALNEPAIVDCLIKHGADQNAIDINGRKPIECDDITSNFLKNEANRWAAGRNIYGNLEVMIFKT